MKKVTAETNNEIYVLQMPTLSQMLRAETDIGQKQGGSDVLDAMKLLHGKVPAADLVLAGLRQYAAIHKGAELVAFIDRIDDLLC